MKVLLCCAAGMSTSILMKKLEKYAADHGIDFEIKATGVGSCVDECVPYDCILLAPQVSYYKERLTDQTGKPLALIPPADYGIGNCEHIFKLIDGMLDGK